MTRWLGKKEKLSALSLSVFSTTVSLRLSYLLLVFFAEWSWRIMELCLNPVPSYLAPTHPSHSHTRPQHKHLSLSLRPQLEPMYHTASHHNTVEWGARTVIVCLHYLCQCTVCGKWLRNAIIHSCHPVLPSIRLMIFCNSPGFPGC